MVSQVRHQKCGGTLLASLVVEAFMENDTSRIQNENITLEITYLFYRPKEEVFDYFVRPELFELWGAPDEMSLKVLRMENRKNGLYTMVHTTQDGNQYVCTGTFLEYIPGKKLVQIDDVAGPDGKLLYHNLETVTEFETMDDETLVTITQSGFHDEQSMQECKKSWEQCLTKLEALFIEGDFSLAAF